MRARNNIALPASLLLAMTLVGSVQAQAIWTGAVNSIWNNSGNWSTGSVPDASTDVIIVPAGNQPDSYSSSAICRGCPSMTSHGYPRTTSSSLTHRAAVSTSTANHSGPKSPSEERRSSSPSTAGDSTWAASGPDTHRSCIRTTSQ